MAAADLDELAHARRVTNLGTAACGPTGAPSAAVAWPSRT